MPGHNIILGTIIIYHGVCWRGVRFSMRYSELGGGGNVIFIQISIIIIIIIYNSRIRSSWVADGAAKGYDRVRSRDVFKSYFHRT